jgi:hypothetical protein
MDDFEFVNALPLPLKEAWRGRIMLKWMAAITVAWAALFLVWKSVPGIAFSKPFIL